MSSTPSILPDMASDVTAGTTLPSSSPSFLISKIGHMKVSASNTTLSLNPSPKDLLMAVPRTIARVGSFVFFTVPERIDGLLGLRNGGSVIAEATAERVNKTVLTTLSGLSSAQSVATPSAESVTATEGTQGGGLSNAFSFQQVRNFGGVFTYMTSRWALSCFTLAIVLNRTSVYASPRRHLGLGFSLRLAIRIVPIILFLFHIKSLLAAMRCQSSPQFSMIKYGNANKKSELDYAGDGGLLYYLSSTLLFWQNDTESCLAVDMVQATPMPDLLGRRGSLSLLWPLFQTLCLSQFIETLSCALQGRHVLTETGMSIFEHSLAFAEAEAMISNQLGLSPFGLPKVGGSKGTRPSNEISDAIELVAKGALFERLNTPPEVLLMGLISSLNHICSHILGVLNMQSRFRLINTGIWGLCFMGSFIWGFFSFTPDGGSDAIILRFPTVCIVGFIPHLLIFIGICICACVYVIAMILSIFSLPNGIPVPTSFLDRIKIAHQNLQATSQLSSLRLNMHEDFYTALLRAGFVVLTVASEAVYLNEGRKISVGRLTWLEEERMQELETSRQSAKRVPHDFSTEVASGVTLAESDRSRSRIGAGVGMGGYAREKTTKILKTGPNGRHSKMAADGVGALQRGGRYIMAWEFFAGIFRTVKDLTALVLIKIFDTVGISQRPRWLFNTRDKRPANVQESTSQAARPDSLEFWLLSDEGVLSLPEDDNVDVEAETKKRLAYAADNWGEEEDRKLDSTLYGWWTHGGWWGERDGSGSFQPTDQEEDTTSVLSQSTYGSEAEWESDDHDGSGGRTPTQREPYTSTRDNSPVMDNALDAHRLARLLAPRDSAEQQEAKMLAHHLTSDRIVTRSSYRHAQDFQRARVLTSTRYRPATLKAGFPDGKLTSQEEAELLEHLLVSRRAPRQAAATSYSSASADVHASSSSGSWQDGAEGLGASGPQCVVCQSSPRTVLAWPCRCLSLCEECRVSLAMNNFGTCVCCRQEVIGFSRLFVP
ncbi:hypothetical protein MMC07_007417 [Pseudocyphellaria aurata]|nr:hypothetical protein [Pseudocyphellaria aurata]